MQCAARSGGLYERRRREVLQGHEIAKRASMTEHTPVHNPQHQQHANRKTERSRLAHRANWTSVSENEMGGDGSKLQSATQITLI